MMAWSFINRLRRDVRGMMAIETALVAPVLIVFSIGTFEVGTMASRQQELQSAASEAEAIILAAAGGTGTDSAVIQQVLADSLGLPVDNVTLEQRFRCNVSDTLVTDASACDPTAPIYRFIKLDLNDRYEPVWARFGVGRAFDYNVSRTIQVQ